LHLHWQIDPAAVELHALAWETLFHPQNDAPLCTSVQVYCARVVDAEVRLRSRRALRALVVALSAPEIPESLSSLSAVPVSFQQRVEAVLGTIPVTLLSLHDEPSRDALRTHILSGYDILYLVGPVAGPAASGEPTLLLHDLLSWIQAAAVRPRLVVVESQCSPERVSTPLASDRGALAVLAQQLVRTGIVAVLLLPAALTPPTRDQLLAVLFEELQHDGQIDRALATARSAVRDCPDWWLPVLLTGSERRALWYTPGFTDERSSLDAALANFRRGRITPILGPGLNESYLALQPQTPENLR
jgi:hypothetical protein